MMLGLIISRLSPLVIFAAAGDKCPLPKPFFFFFPPWWEYLNGTEVIVPGPGKVGATKDILQCIPAFAFPDGFLGISLAILDMLLRLAGFVAIISIIIAGAMYIFSGGNPEKAASARWRLYNSLIGLAIVAVATAVVTFIGKQLA